MKRKHWVPMKRNFILFFTAVLFFISVQGYSQHDGVHKCYTTELEQLNQQRYPEWKSQREQFEKDLKQQVLKLKNSKHNRVEAGALLKIPVVVHILHNEANGAITDENIPDQRVLEQIVTLNRDFRRANADAINTPIIYNGIATDTQIEFCLANRDPLGFPTSGINRVYNAKSPFIYPNDDALLKSLSYWPSDQYLNIWVCRMSDNSQTNKILGYAQFPSNTALGGLSNDEGPASTDGVVIHYTVFGMTSDASYNLGRTTTHEVGHWLGLLHTWGDGDCSVDDYIDDTPNCDDQYFSDRLTCIAPIQCGGRRMIENYMDYSDDACMNLYTVDQKTRMQTALTLSPRRAALINSKGCCDTCTTNTELNVFPNPSNGTVKIQIQFQNATDVDLYIYDRIGKLVYQEQDKHVTRYNKFINVSYWTDGLYYIVMKTSNNDKFYKRLQVLN